MCIILMIYTYEIIIENCILTLLNSLLKFMIPIVLWEQHFDLIVVCTYLYFIYNMHNMYTNSIHSNIYCYG